LMHPDEAACADSGSPRLAPEAWGVGGMVGAR
jgi:hypothetical protein